MSDVVYVSKVRIERRSGPLRVAHLPGEARPVAFSVHGPIAAHYGMDEKAIKESHATTLDYVIAAAGGWLMGTFGGALEARKINASDGRLTADVRGEVEITEDGVLVIRRIHVELRLTALEEARATVERVHTVYAEKCPVYRSLKGSIAITSNYRLIAPSEVAG